MYYELSLLSRAWRKDWQAPLAFELRAQPATLRAQCTTQPATTAFQSVQDRADPAARSDPLTPERSDLRPRHSAARPPAHCTETPPPLIARVPISAMLVVTPHFGSVSSPLQSTPRPAQIANLE